MSVQRDELLISAIKWCQAVLPSITWAWARQNDPIPGLPFGTVNLLSFQETARGVKRYEYAEITDTLQQFIEGNGKAIYSINIFGDISFDSMNALRASCVSQQFKQILQDNGLIYVENSPIRDITAVESSKWEQRAQMDITFLVSYVYNYDIDRINQVTVLGDLNDSLITTEQTINEL